MWLRVFNIKCFDWGGMTKPTLGINPLVAPNVTSSLPHQVVWLRKHEKTTLGIKPLAALNVSLSFQHQVLWLKRHGKINTVDEPYSCALGDFKSSTSSAWTEDHIFTDSRQFHIFVIQTLPVDLWNFLALEQHHRLLILLWKKCCRQILATVNQ